MLLTNQTIHNRYYILGPLGQGGMGAVYLAEDHSLGRRCAIKENVPDPKASFQALAQMRQQFQAEASILAKLDHPNLPKVHDFFSIGGNEYIVMEYVEGENLHSLQEREEGPLQEQMVLGWANQILDALAYLHGQQPHPIIHRDIKPANIILTPQGKVSLVDFGLVKLLDPSNPRTATVMKGMGTAEYAPLEQYAGGVGHTDARTDIYSLGGTLYHLLTGEPPLDVHQRLLDPGRMPSPRQLNPLLSVSTDGALMKALEIHPNQRFSSVIAMRDAMKRMPDQSSSAVSPVAIEKTESPGLSLILPLLILGTPFAMLLLLGRCAS